MYEKNNHYPKMTQISLVTKLSCNLKGKGKLFQASDFGVNSYCLAAHVLNLINSVIDCENTSSGVPQGSVLGPIIDDSPTVCMN